MAEAEQTQQPEQKVAEEPPKSKSPLELPVPKFEQDDGKSAWPILSESEPTSPANSDVNGNAQRVNISKANDKIGPIIERMETDMANDEKNKRIAELEKIAFEAQRNLQLAKLDKELIHPPGTTPPADNDIGASAHKYFEVPRKPTGGSRGNRAEACAKLRQTRNHTINKDLAIRNRPNVRFDLPSADKSKKVPPLKYFPILNDDGQVEYVSKDKAPFYPLGHTYGFVHGRQTMPNPSQRRDRSPTPYPFLHAKAEKQLEGRSRQPMEQPSSSRKFRIENASQGLHAVISCLEKLEGMQEYMQQVHLLEIQRARFLAANKCPGNYGKHK